MNYDFKKKRYASVRMNKGGGSREVRFELGAGKEDILEAGIDLFFTDGISSLGRAEDFLFQLGNYSCEEIGEEIDGKKFSLGRYQDKYKLSRIRMYLMTKKKNWLQKVESHSGDDSDEDDFQPAFKLCKNSNNKENQSSSIVSQCQSSSCTVTQGTEGTALIGSSEERLCLKNEIDRAYEESLKADKEKELKKKQQNSIKVEYGTLFGLILRRCNQIITVYF